MVGVELIRGRLRSVLRSRRNGSRCWNHHHITDLGRLALAIEQREAAGTDIRTLILDEPSAGLSEENCKRYMEMTRQVLDETGFEQVLMVSHMPVVKQLSDGVIEVMRDPGKQSSMARLAA